MKRVRGFTLVELLVVIAIISILAAIVTPQVSRYILRAQIARAEEEIHGIEVALAGMLSDTGVRDVRHMFPATFNYANWRASANVYTDFYELLRIGRQSSIANSMRDEVRQKLGTSYMAELGKDPWGNLYRVSPGPWRASYGPIIFRAYRGTGDPEDPSWQPYIYDSGQAAAANADIPGAPEADDEYGYPAPFDMTFYIWSIGPNMLEDQLGSSNPEQVYLGGGDDINNWDSDRGWAYFQG